MVWSGFVGLVYGFGLVLLKLVSVVWLRLVTFDLVLRNLCFDFVWFGLILGWFPEEVDAETMQAFLSSIAGGQAFLT
jgi:hypothetical protein